MKNILIVAATYSEIKFLEKYNLKISDSRSNLFSFTVNSATFDVIITGVGMVATTYNLTQQLSKLNYDLCLNVGIAGAFDKTIRLGETVNIITDCFADLGAEDEDNFLSVFDLGLINENEFPFENGLLRNKTHLDIKTIEALKKVSGVTLNLVHGNNASISKFIAQHETKYQKPKTESMEGAAFFYVCMQMNVPCFQIRSISNYIEKRNRSEWKIDVALNSLEKFITNFVEEITT